MFVPWVLLIQADASIGDTAFQSAEAGEGGLKQCPSVTCKLKAKTSTTLLQNLPGELHLGFLWHAMPGCPAACFAGSWGASVHSC